MYRPTFRWISQLSSREAKICSMQMHSPMTSRVPTRRWVAPVRRFVVTTTTALITLARPTMTRSGRSATRRAPRRTRSRSRRRAARVRADRASRVPIVRARRPDAGPHPTPPHRERVERRLRPRGRSAHHASGADQALRAVARPDLEGCKFLVLKIRLRGVLGVPPRPRSTDAGYGWVVALGAFTAAQPSRRRRRGTAATECGSTRRDCRS